MHPRVRIVAAVTLTLALAAMVLPAPSGGVSSFGAFGSKVAAADNDFAVNYADPSGAGVTIDGTQPSVCRLVNSGGSGILTDYYYLHWAADCVSVATGDIRLTTTAGGAAGTTVQSGSADHGQGFAQDMGPFLANVRYLETDGFPGFSSGDFIYFSADATLDAVAGDIRLVSGTTNSLTSTAGTLVTSSAQTEVTEAADGDGIFPDSTGLTGLPGGAALRYFDVNGNGQFDHNIDRLYLAALTGITAYPSINDVVLSSANSQTFGARFIASNTEYVRQLTQLAAADAQIVVTNEVTTPEASRHLFIHFPDTDTTNNHILQDDIIVKAGSGSFGTRVSSVAQGQREEIGGTASLAANLYFLDIDSNNHYTPETDPVYINRPAALGGSADTDLDALDIRVTPVTVGGQTYAIGSVVAASDQDVSSWGGLVANDGLTGQWFAMLHNVDQTSPVALTTATQGKTSGADAAWTEAIDGAYLAAGSAVAGGDVRLQVMPHLARVTLECDGTAPDHPSCAAVLAASDANLRSTTSGGTWTATTAVYYSADATVGAGDIRYYHPTLVPGAVVGGDADIGTALHVVASGNNYFRSTGDPSAFGTVGSLFHDVDLDGVIETSDTLLYKTWAAAPAVGSTVSCIVGTYHEDCGAPVAADANIRITGTDATYTAARSEYAYYSRDGFVNAGDFRFLAVGGLGAGVAVLAADADTTRTALGATDEFVLSWCEGATGGGGACENHPNSLLQVGDLQVGAGTVTRITAAATGHAPTLTAVTAAVANQALKRYDLNAGNGLVDDTFYLSFFATADKVSQNDIRLTPFAAKAAGTQVINTDTQEISATVIQHNADSAADGADHFAQLIKYVELDGGGSYSAGDTVYVDNFDADLIGGTDPGPRTGDIRLTSFSSGSSFAAGTTVFAGNGDATMAWGGSNPTWTLYYFDENRDGSVSLGEAVYINPGASEGSATVGTPSLFAVRLVGTTPTTPVGGGATTTTTTTPPTTTTTTPPTTTTTTAPTTTTTAPIDEASVAVTLANAGLATSLEVRRLDGDNLLSWQVQPGVAGYQIWVSTSPFEHVADISDPSVRNYTHVDGPANGQYLVTAWAMDGATEVGKLVDVNNAVVKGNEDRAGVVIPADGGTSTATGGPTDDPDEPVPGLGLLVLVGVLAGLVVLVRRRL